jgi:hypothetical protein
MCPWLSLVWTNRELLHCTSSSIPEAAQSWLTTSIRLPWIRGEDPYRKAIISTRSDIAVKYCRQIKHSSADQNFFPHMTLKLVQHAACNLVTLQHVSCDITVKSHDCFATTKEYTLQRKVFTFHTAISKLKNCSHWLCMISCMQYIHLNSWF